MNTKKLALLLLGIVMLLFSGCATQAEIETQSINKEVSIDAKIAAIDSYGNITLNILTNDMLQARFNYDNNLLLEFSNGYLLESSLTVSNNIKDGQCYIRTVSKDNPITVSVKTKNLAEMGTLQIGDVIKISQLIAN